MPTKDDQEGRVKNAILPTTAHTTPETAGPGAIGSYPKDESWKQNFPQAAQAGAARDEYQMTADARRIQAERAANLERARQAKVNDEPVPSGEGDNPHENEAELPKHETQVRGDDMAQDGGQTVRDNAGGEPENK